MKKIMVVFGTRPEAIKMCPLVIELKNNKNFSTIVVSTGQHREMLDQVLNIFNVRTDIDLSLMEKNQTLSSLTEKILNRMSETIEREKPDIVLVHGDTTTAFAASLSAFYHRIPVGHVEAGLRTSDMFSPYPEEFNRCAISLTSELNFSPTDLAKENLLKEGKRLETVFVTGNTGIDALRYTVNENYKSEHLTWAEGSRLILLTAHRRESLGKPMENMFRAIRRVTDENKDIKILYPLHKNPKVRYLAEKYLGNSNRIRFTEPLEVSDFHNIMSRSYLILTDSGGIQEEAPSLGKPILVMRDTTERPEGVIAGTLKLTGTSEDEIYTSFTELLNDPLAYEKMSKASNPYGDGYASSRISLILQDYLKDKQDISN